MFSRCDVHDKFSKLDLEGDGWGLKSLHNHHVQARVRIDAKVNDLLDETHEIKEWVKHEVRHNTSLHFPSPFLSMEDFSCTL